MNIINVIKLKFGVVDSIKSFTEDNVKDAELYFLNIADELGYISNDDDEDNNLLDDGYYQKEYDTEMNCVCITWSSINFDNSACK